MLPGMDRARAWVLLKVKDPKAVVAEFERPRGNHQGKVDMGLMSWGGAGRVIVRADMVEGEGGWNLVVPVDASSDTALSEAISEVTMAAGDRLVARAVLHVKEHHPRVPHQAHSYVTEAELGTLPDKAFPAHGRHWPASPGANPWG